VKVAFYLYAGLLLVLGFACLWVAPYSHHGLMPQGLAEQTFRNVGSMGLMLGTLVAVVTRLVWGD
jgi:hypothetical protein